MIPNPEFAPLSNRGVPAASAAIANLHAAILAFPSGVAVGPACHRCGADATTQWQRHATETEHEAHWAASEQHIRSIPDLFGHGTAEYTADRSHPVVKAVFGCDEHPDPAPGTTHVANCGGHGACSCDGAA